MRLSRNSYSVFMGFILGLLFIVLFALLSFSPKPKAIEVIIPELTSQYDATCKIEAGAGISTGVLLDTGFIITCGHGVDKNKDWKVQNNERDVTVEFQGKRKYRARVITIGKDYSIIQTNVPMRSKISMALGVPKIGESVYTFGFPAGRGLHLTKGYQSGPAFYGPNFDLQRTSIDAYMGNSGGGIFNRDGNVAGILKSIGVDRRVSSATFMVPVPIKETMILLRFGATFRYIHPLAGWSDYLATKNIYSALNKKGLGFTIIPVEDYTSQFDYNLVLSGFIQIWIVLIVVALFRRELFCK